MKELLKEYHLYEDLSRLNNIDYFQSDFKIPEVQQVFLGVKSHSQFMKDRSCQLFLLNLKTTEDKNVYLVMKWLICVHRLINLPICGTLLEALHLCLSQIGTPKLESVFQEYVYVNLLKSYTQYLQKLCLLELRHRQPIDTQRSDLSKENERWFIDCNLVRFGVNEFSVKIKQFGGFFKECYPFLSFYSIMIEADLKKIMSQVRVQYRRQQQKLIEWRELEQFEHILQNMCESNTLSISKEYLLTEPDLCESKVKAFLQSGGKDDLIVSLIF